ncbi:unnamed protein product [Spirodela intermedia]|uniref:Uncharacterized protein n=1 Tax=Spirodela intermedia TaxID=51605 RepID=A0A7I8LLL9_SPIIN|nr:unnamed protein product [Spirodela intermedia]
MRGLPVTDERSAVEEEHEGEEVERELGYLRAQGRRTTAVEDLFEAVGKTVIGIAQTAKNLKPAASRNREGNGKTTHLSGLVDPAEVGGGGCLVDVEYNPMVPMLSSTENMKKLQKGFLS